MVDSRPHFSFVYSLSEFGNLRDHRGAFRLRPRHEHHPRNVDGFIELQVVHFIAGSLFFGDNTRTKPPTHGRQVVARFCFGGTKIIEVFGICGKFPDRSKHIDTSLRFFFFEQETSSKSKQGCSQNKVTGFS